MVGMHLEDAVYAPLYYGYGGPGQYAERTEFARHTEERILGLAPDVIEILVRATPEVIRQRMREAPHRNQTIKEADVEYVLEQFEKQHAASLIRNKMEIEHVGDERGRVRGAVCRVLRAADEPMPIVCGPW